MPTYSKGKHDTASLANIQKQMQDWIRRLEEIKVSMKDEHIPVLIIQHQAELERAIDKVPKFLESGKERIRQTLKDRGDFEAGDGQSEKKKPARK